MPRKFTAHFSGVTLNGLHDFFELVVPSTSVIVITRIQIFDDVNESSENAKLLLKRGIGSTAGSGGTTPTARQHSTGDAASDVSVRANATTPATAGGGSLETDLVLAFNWLSGLDYAPLPEDRIEYSPSQRVVIAPGAAPDNPSSRTISGTVSWEEYGG